MRLFRGKAGIGKINYLCHSYHLLKFLNNGFILNSFYLLPTISL
jgi:hypothetical protein